MSNEKLAQARAKCAAVALYMADRDDMRAAASLKAGLKLLEELQSELAAHEAEKQAGPVAGSLPSGLMEAVDSVLEEAPCECPYSMRHERGEHLSGCWLFDLNIERGKLAALPSPPAEQDKEDAELLLRRLVEQIDKAEFVEENGHRLKMNTAYIAAKELL